MRGKKRKHCIICKEKKLKGSQNIGYGFLFLLFLLETCIFSFSALSTDLCSFTKKILSPIKTFGCVHVCMCETK